MARWLLDACAGLSQVSGAGSVLSRCPSRAPRPGCCLSCNN